MTRPGARVSPFAVIPKEPPKTVKQRQRGVNLSAWVKKFPPGSCSVAQAASGQALFILDKVEKGPFPLSGTTPRACMIGWSVALTLALQKAGPPYNRFKTKIVEGPIAPNCPRMAHTKCPLRIRDPPGAFVTAWKMFLCDVVAATALGRRDFSDTWANLGPVTAERNRARKGQTRMEEGNTRKKRPPCKRKQRSEKEGEKEERPAKKATRSRETPGGRENRGSAPGHGRATSSSST